MLVLSCSDASSGYLSAVDLTDSEDAGRNGSVVGQDTTGPQVAVMGGSYGGLSPMIIMNNFVLKQVKHSSVLYVCVCLTLFGLFVIVVVSYFSFNPSLCFKFALKIAINSDFPLKFDLKPMGAKTDIQNNSC